MRPEFLKTSAMAALVCLAHFTGTAQDDAASLYQDAQKDTGKTRPGSEIIIRQKGGKASKITVEIRDGQVLVNGKPAAQYEDSNISVRIRDANDMTLGALSDLDLNMAGPRINISPFQFEPGGTFNMDGGGTFNPDGGGTFNMDRALPKNRPMLGVLSENPEKAGSGAKVKEVTKGSAAEKAGLKPGDLITKLDEIPVTGPMDLSDAVRKYKPKDKVVLTFTRDGKSQKVTATLGEAKGLAITRMQPLDGQGMMLTMPPGEYGQRNYNYNFREATPGPRLGIKAQDTEEGKGVKVLDVTEDSPADKAGIKEGDIITRFDGRSTDDAATLKMLAWDRRNRTSVKVNLLRDGKAMELEVKTPRKLRSAEL